MSAFIVSKAHIDALVTAAINGRISWMTPAPEVNPDTHQRGEPWGPAALAEYQARQRTANTETAGTVGAMLWNENQLSVNHRYDEEDAEEPYTYDRFNRPLSPVQILKAISCYEYQTCERPEWEASEARAFCRALRSETIHKLPGYDEAAWEITNAPPAPVVKEERPPYIPPAEAIKVIRSNLKRKCKTLSVRMGRGTAYGWIEIWSSGDMFNDAERAALVHFGIKHGGNCAVISTEEQPYVIRRMNAQ